MTGDSAQAAASGTALVALFSWPAVALSCYALRRRRASAAATTAWMLMLPVMFLPSGMAWDPPLLPPLTKFRIALLSVALALRIFHHGQVLRRAPMHNVPRVIFLLFLLGAARTVAANDDVLVFGGTVLPALTWYDFLSAAVGEFLDTYLPFSIGQRVFRNDKALIDLFKVMSTCALIYAPLMLFEVRMSPQLHMWVYGYYPSEFQQAMRGGGFRPIVFMNHGLSVAGWMFSCVCAALSLKAAGVSFLTIPTRLRVLLSWGLLLLTKSLGPVMYAAVATAVRAWSTRAAARLVMLVAILVTAYPVLRAEGVFPTQQVLGFFERFSEERAASLKFRFDNEDLLLRHAMERPAFGWGTFGRNHVYSTSGKDESVTDGEWIIALGSWGYVGHVSFFALLVLPLLRYLRRRARMPAAARVLCSGLAVLVSLFVLDLLPNARSDYLSVIYAGALWTLAERLSRKQAPAKQSRPLAPRAAEESVAPAPEQAASRAAS
jgi:hypothetical protein